MNIVEIPNKKVKIKKIQMNTNPPIPDNTGKVFEYYSFCIGVFGKPQSGKTSLIIDQLTRPHGMFYRKFNRIYIFSPSLHSVKKKINIPDEQKFTTFDLSEVQKIVDNQLETIRNTPEEIDEVLIIFDDLMMEIKKSGSDETLSRIVNNRRHCHLSCIFIQQTYNSIPAIIRRNFSDVIIFNTNSELELESVRKELTKFNKKEFKEITKFAYESPHDFLLFRIGQIFRNFNELKINETIEKESNNYNNNNNSSSEDESTSQD